MAAPNRLKEKIANVVRRLKQSWGSAETKRRLWNSEFERGRWDFIDNSEGDVIYDFIGKYCRGGSILDLGCGAGNTGCELDTDVYSEYLGIDVSDVALNKAAVRSRHVGRHDKNRYAQADIVEYVPSNAFDVILFRESIYYVPRSKIVSMLLRYKEHLTPEGVIIVRWHNHKTGMQLLDMLRPRFTIVETVSGNDKTPFIAAFR